MATSPDRDVPASDRKPGAPTIRLRSRTWASTARFWASLPVGLAAASVMLPGLAGPALVMIVLSGWQEGATAFGIASGIGAGATAVLALACRNFAFPETANPTAYGELCTEFDQLRADLQALFPTGTPTPCAQTDRRIAAVYHQAREQSLALQAALACSAEHSPSKADFSWLLASGYTNAWRRLHRANEALIEVKPIEEVIREAVADAFRLQGSAIPQHEKLLGILRQALADLNETAAGYLSSDDSPASPPAKPLAETEARAILRGIRETINGFRDDCRDGIVRARNRLAAALIFCGLTTYAILGLAVANHASTTAIVAGVTFYLVGGVTGLFKQLHSASTADPTSEEDYHLSTVRLLHTPLISGLAAVGGVAITVILGGANEIPTLTEIFDLSTNTKGLVIAAIFGLTPALLLTRLQAHTNKYKADLKATEAAQAAPAR